MNYAHGHPLDSKEALAQWMGYETVEAMDTDHDRTHEDLSLAFGFPSYSLKVRDGEQLTPDEQSLAHVEEAAVLHVQRWLQWSRLVKDGKRPQEIQICSANQPS